MAAAQASIAVPAAGKCAASMAAEIANAENIYLSQQSFVAEWIFRTKCDFLQVLDLLIFRQKQPGHWGRGCLPFSPNFECYLVAVFTC